MYDNYYLNDLSLRQNKNITCAQLHSYKNVRKYSDEEIKNAGRYFMTKEQVNLDGQKAEAEKGTRKRKDGLLEEVEEMENTIKLLREGLDNKDKEINELNKPDRWFVYEKKLVMIDDKSNSLILKYKQDLFTELIEEFKKLYEWLDSRSAYLKFDVGDEGTVVIDKTEVKTVIHFFEKLNKMKDDTNEI